VDTAEKLPTVLSLCTGYGGIERGLDLAGVEHRVIAHVEIEAFAIANLVAKMEASELDAAPVWSNLKTLPVESFRDRVDILTGGYPCQPFSAAGKRLGEEDPRHLWPYIKEIIRAVRPVRCFFENVEGHISLGLREVISDLESLGYTTAWGIFSAREVGAPHQRKRVYIMADSSELAGGRREVHRELGNKGGETSATGREGLRSENNEAYTNHTEQSGEDVADTREFSNTRNNGVSIRHPESSKQSQQRQTSDAYASCPTLSNAFGQRLEGQPRNGKDCDQSGWIGEKTKRSTGKSSVRNREPHQWPSEPKLGRVVDGCANRVDRIRLLGNGVVPQTAAKAWMVLSEELLES